MFFLIEQKILRVYFDMIRSISNESNTLDR